MESKLVELKVIGLISEDGVHLVIQCPFCGMIHLHGAGKKGEPVAYGDRSPHCSTIRETSISYEIIPPPSQEVEQALRENLRRKVKKEKYCII